MSQRLTRKDIKKDIQHDSFRDTIEQALDYAGSHVKTLLLIAVGIVAAVLIGVGIYSWQQGRESRASEALYEATTAYQAFIDEDDPKPDDPRAPRYASEEARRQRAKELFTEVHDRFGGTESGKVALMYLGKIALEEGDVETARQHWAEFVEESDDHVLTIETSLNLLALDRQQGRAEEVAQRLEEMLDTPDAKLPGDALLFELAATYEELGREQEALDTYRRLVEEFSASSYVQEAQQRLAALGGAPAMPSRGFPQIGGLTG